MPGPATIAAVASSVVRPGTSAATAPGTEAEAERERKNNKMAGMGVVLFSFGDSNSDKGSVAAAVMGICIPPPEGRAYF